MGKGKDAGGEPAKGKGAKGKGGDAAAGPSGPGLLDRLTGLVLVLFVLTLAAAHL